MKRSRIFILIACILFVSLCVSPAGAAADDIPSIFIGDNEWYRDKMDPLITRGERDYVPVDVFEMFYNISVTTPKEGNILIHNTATGQYVSMLFGNRSAAVNGSVINNMGIFMNGETYYVDAETVSLAIGLEYEAKVALGKRRTVRIYDDDVYYTFDELISPYASSDDDGYVDGSDGTAGVSGKPKRIYILCSQSATGYNKPQFSASEILCEYGLSYTMFLYDASRTEDVIAAAAQGEYGIYLSYFGSMSAKDAYDSLNSDVKKVTHKLTHITIDHFGNEVPGGYYTIEADFTVNGVLSSTYVYGQITEYFKTHDYCTLFLEDCWNSEQMIILLSKLDTAEIITSNLAGGR